MGTENTGPIKSLLYNFLEDIIASFCLIINLFGAFMSIFYSVIVDHVSLVEHLNILISFRVLSVLMAQLRM